MEEGSETMRHKWRYVGNNEVECERCGLRTNHSQARRGTGRCSGEKAKP